MNGWEVGVGDGVSKRSPWIYLCPYRNSFPAFVGTLSAETQVRLGTAVDKRVKAIAI
jgi:hypothetical protein